MVLLVLAVELGVLGRESYLTGGPASWIQAGQAIEGPAREARILCFGDSMVKFGIVPRLLAQELGLPAYNLAVHSGPPAMSHFLLERALRGGIKPAAIVVDFDSHQFGRRPDHPPFERPWAEFASLEERLNLARTLGQPDFFTSGLVARLLPSFRARHELRQALAARAAGQAFSTRRRTQVLQRNWAANLGAQLMPCGGERPVLRLDNHELFAPQWRIEPTTLVYMERFLARAHTEGIPVYWLLPPLLPGAQERLEAMGIAQEFAHFVRAQQARYDNLVVLDARHAGNQPAQHYDMVHLNREGAVSLTRAVARGIGPDLRNTEPFAPSSRWRALRMYRETPEIQAPTEDLEQSLVALREERAQRVR